MPADPHSSVTVIRGLERVPLWAKGHKAQLYPSPRSAELHGAPWRCSEPNSHPLPSPASRRKDSAHRRPLLNCISPARGKDKQAMFQPQSQMLAAVKCSGKMCASTRQEFSAQKPELKQLGRHRMSPFQGPPPTNSSACYWKEGAGGRFLPGPQKQGSLPALWS